MTPENGKNHIISMSKDDGAYKQAIMQIVNKMGQIHKRCESEGLRTSEVLEMLLTEILIYVPDEVKRGLRKIFDQID